MSSTSPALSVWSTIVDPHFGFVVNLMAVFYLYKVNELQGLLYVHTILYDINCNVVLLLLLCLVASSNQSN